jgi:hypothetical protein
MGIPFKNTPHTSGKPYSAAISLSLFSHAINVITYSKLPIISHASCIHLQQVKATKIFHFHTVA